MRISRLIVVILLGTVFSVLYVYQQAEIFRLAYEGERKQSAFQELLDKNNVLRYNIEKSASLIRIGNKVSRDDQFQMPDTCRVVKVGSVASGTPAGREEGGVLTLASRIFSIKRQAEAHTIQH
ncbi:MAG: hypothetical protein PHE11_02645 [Candidatus Omnitrophica bacterium]|jgi:hypothetical protein|nr:hypothetical protein [Candidatus Omnitrophota bacterium]MDD5526286.1 hypothetical protein [Candidatus Omnitrophota bacterium]